MSRVRCRKRLHSIEPLEPRIVLDASLVITEFLARNDGSRLDEDGDSSDWIEIYNAGDMSGDLSGWSLTDDSLVKDKWTLPSVTLEPGAFLTVFASLKDRTDPQAELHTNFRLDGDGGYLALVEDDGLTIASEFLYENQFDDVSFGLAMTATDRLVPVIPLDPSSLDTYVHLRADSGVTQVGTTLTRWEDQSDSGFIFQANHPNAFNNDPQLVAGPGGLPAVQFDGNDLVDSDLELQLFTSETSGLAVFTVLRPTITGNQQVLVNHAPGIGGDSFELGPDSGEAATPGAWGIHRGSGNATSTAAGTLQDGQFQLMTSQILSTGNDGDNVQFFQNGQLLSNAAGLWTAAGSYNTGDDPLAIGARIDNKGQGFELLTPNSWFQGDVAEIIIFRQTLSEAQRLGIDQFLSDKYALGLQLNAVVNTDIEIVPGEFGFLTTPTPDDVNSVVFEGFVADTKFDGDPLQFRGRGFYDAAFDVTITTTTPGATIVYTTDGSTPTLAGGGVQVSAANELTPPVATLRVTTTTTLRTAAFKPGLVSTNVDTQTYLFLQGEGTEGVLNQPAGPAGFPSSGWGRNGPDYAIDPDVVNNPLYSSDLVDGLTQIRTISLVTDLDNLFGGSGIFSNPQSRGRSWERPVSVEIFDPISGEQIQENAGIRIQGGVGRSGTKLSMRLYFRDEYGAKKLNFPLIAQTDVEIFDKLVLRAQWNNGWHHPDAAANFNANSTYMRDEFNRRTLADMGYLTANGDYVQVYINGLYWGLYNVTERIDGDFVAAHFGGDETDYDVLKNNASGTAEVLSGDRVVWNQVMALANSDLSNFDNYQQLLALVDVESLADFMLQYIFTGTEDSPGKGQNMYRKREPGAKFQFLPWDTEWSLGTRFAGARRLDAFTVDHDASDSPLRIFQSLRNNADFRILFADRVQLRMFDDGVMSVQGNIDRFEALISELEKPIVGESARWGDFANPLSPGNPLTRDVEWDSENTWLTGTFFPQRHDIVIAQLVDAGLFPSLAAPDYDPTGSVVFPGAEVTLTAGEGGEPGDPTFSGPELLLTELNGQPVLRFDGTDFLTSDRDMQLFDTPSSPLTVFIVFEADNNEGAQYLINHRVGPGSLAENFELGYDTGLQIGSGNFGVHGGGAHATVSPPDTILNNEFAILTTEVGDTNAAPNNLTFLKNGSSLTSAADVGGWLGAGSYSTSSAPLDIGARVGSSGPNPHTGDIAEIIIFKDELTTVQRAGVEKYLSDKYGIAVAGGLAMMPDAIANLEVWLKADAGVTTQQGIVTAWQDQSANSYMFITDLGSIPVDVDAGLYYTLDGGDPRAPGGGLAASALLFEDPIAINSTTTITARVIADGIWSPLVSQLYTVEIPLRITELMYNPDGDDGSEYVELFNTSDISIPLAGIRFSGEQEGIEFTLDASEPDLGPDDRIVVVRNQVAFAARYDTGRMRVAIGQFGDGGTKLSNAGETIMLLDAGGGLIQSFTYRDDWFKETDGDGFSLVPIDTAGDYDSGANWRSSAWNVGSPGLADPTPAVADFNGSGTTGRGDLVAVLKNLGRTTGAHRGRGDADLDGSTSLVDLAGLQTSLGDETTPLPPAGPAPSAAPSALLADVHFSRTSDRPTRLRDTISANRRDSAEERTMAIDRSFEQLDARPTRRSGRIDLLRARRAVRHDAVDYSLSADGHENYELLHLSRP